MKYLFQIIAIITSTLLISCQDDATEQDQTTELMGRFDSIIVNQDKGPSLESIYDNSVKHISFPSEDSVTIHADIYEIEEGKAKILLCHQAGYSRGAYKQTGIFLSKLGFNAMAIDQRSGESALDIPNLTCQDAKTKGLPTEYLDAKKDIEAAIDYLYDYNGNEPIILLGSSYSASLCLMIAAENCNVKAVIAFSPGEYLEGISVKDSIACIDVPTFVTSSKLEIPQTSQLISKIDTSLVTHFKPTVEGVHGARALWKETEGHKEYWNALLKFLKANY